MGSHYAVQATNHVGHCNVLLMRLPQPSEKIFIVLAGLWCSSEKPDMNLSYLKPFVKELKSLENKAKCGLIENASNLS